jgi:hypothetical protein
MVSKRQMPEQKPQATERHPVEEGLDLNPSHMAGQNIGDKTDVREGGPRVANLRELALDLMNEGLSKEDLRQIPVVDTGVRLEQGATYVDLKNPRRIPFTASGTDIAEAHMVLVPKAEVPYPLWNRLIRVPEDVRKQ